MSWLSDRLGIHLNLRPLAAPAGYLAGGLLGGQVGAGIGAGLAKFADNKLHGDSWTHSLEQGALNGAAYGVGGPALGHLKEAFGGANAAGGTPGAFMPSSSAPFEFGDEAAGAATGGGGGGSFLGSVGTGAKNAGSWIASHPNAVGGALQGAGQIGAMGSENAMRKAQTTAIDQQNSQSQYELEAKKKRDAALAPLIQALMGQAQNGLANPYKPPMPSNGPHYTSSPYAYG